MGESSPLPLRSCVSLLLLLHFRIFCDERMYQTVQVLFNSDLQWFVQVCRTIDTPVCRNAGAVLMYCRHRFVVLLQSTRRAE